MKMNCPKCTHPLIHGESREYETLCDHICNPNQTSYPKRPTFVCINTDCECSSSDVFWDENGDYYGHGRIKFNNNLRSACPSFSRKMDIEIYKKGLKSEIYLHPALMLWFLQPKIEFHYKGDEYGNVLKRTWSLVWLRKDGGAHNQYCTHYTFPIVSFIRSMQSNYRKIQYYKESNGESMHALSELKDMFKPLPSWDKRWYRHATLFVSKLIFIKYYNILKI